MFFFHFPVKIDIYVSYSLLLLLFRNNKTNCHMILCLSPALSYSEILWIRLRNCLTPVLRREILELLDTGLATE